MASRPDQTRIPLRPLGNSGLEVSAIAFGTGDNAGLMVKGREAQQTAAVARALELGINVFDTSPDYGKGLAEGNLGRALRTLRHDTAAANAIISTKVEIMPPDLGDIAGKVVRSVDDSLRRLGRDAVDILMIHNPPRLNRDPSAAYWTPLTPADFLGPALEGLERVRAQGKARHFGFTCENAQAAAVIPLLETGRFAAINCWYNLVNPSAGRVMPEGVRFGADYDDYGGIITAAGRCGVGVAVIRPLAGGGLTRQVIAAGAAGRHALAGGVYSRKPEAFRPEIERARAFAFLDRPEASPPRSLPQAAYQFALMHPAVSTVVGGYSDLAQLEEVALGAVMRPLDAGELERIDRIWASNFGL